MIVLCVMNCPPSLRGDLSKWLNEVNTGVYVGKLSARVRDELWDRVCENIKSGQATMVYSTNNEQGFTFLTHNTTWKPIDYEGITLMQKPLPNSSVEQNDFLQPGFSKAAKYEKIRHFQNHNSKKSVDYVVLDIETTGLDYNKDRIIEVGLLRVSGEEIKDQFQCLIYSKEKIPNDIIRLTGITNEMLEKEGIAEEEALKIIQDFIGTDLVVGYNVQFDIQFVQKLGKQVGKDIIIKKTKDVLHMVRLKLDDLDNYKLETVALYLSLDIKNIHRALTDCILTYKIYSELNKL